MIFKKHFSRTELPEAVAAALILTVVAAAPAWAGDCRTGKNMEIKVSDVAVVTEISNQQKINLANPGAKDIRVRVFSSPFNEDKKPSLAGWRLSKGWTTLKAATGDSLTVKANMVLALDTTTTISDYIYYRIDVELPKGQGIATCKYNVQYLSYANGERNSTVYFSGCTGFDPSLNLMVCSNEKKTGNSGKNPKWTTSFALTTPGATTN